MRYRLSYGRIKCQKNINVDDTKYKFNTPYFKLNTKKIVLDACKQFILVELGIKFSSELGRI